MLDETPPTAAGRADILSTGHIDVGSLIST